MISSLNYAISAYTPPSSSSPSPPKSKFSPFMHSHTSLPLSNWSACNKWERRIDIDWVMINDPRSRIYTKFNSFTKIKSHSRALALAFPIKLNHNSVEIANSSKQLSWVSRRRRLRWRQWWCWQRLMIHDFSSFSSDFNNAFNSHVCSCVCCSVRDLLYFSAFTRFLLLAFFSLFYYYYRIREFCCSFIRVAVRIADHALYRSDKRTHLFLSLFSVLVFFFVFVVYVVSA